MSFTGGGSYALIGGRQYVSGIAFSAEHPPRIGCQRFETHGKLTHLSSQVGLSDRNTAGLRARLSIFADGRLVGTYDPQPGQLLPIELDLTGVTNLDLEESTTVGVPNPTDFLFVVDPKVR